MRERGTGDVRRTLGSIEDGNKGPDLTPISEL